MTDPLLVKSKLFLYGNPTYPFNEKKLILNASIKYILKAKRSDGPVLSVKESWSMHSCQNGKLKLLFLLFFHYFTIIIIIITIITIIIIIIIIIISRLHHVLDVVITIVIVIVVVVIIIIISPSFSPFLRDP